MVNDSLNYIEQWLAANASQILNESPNLGATENPLATLETLVDKFYPKTHKTLYCQHDEYERKSKFV